MKVPMKWLAEYVDTGLTAKDLARRMTMAGLEAEKIEEIGDDLGQGLRRPSSARSSAIPTPTAWCWPMSRPASTD